MKSWAVATQLVPKFNAVLYLLCLVEVRTKSREDFEAFEGRNEHLEELFPIFHSSS